MNISVFIGVTLILAGGAAFMIGQSIAGTWKPLSHAVGYTLLLGLADRFIIYALFDGELLSLGGYLTDTAVLLAITMLAFRLTQVKKMVSQYPWLYRRSGLFSWGTVK